MLLVLPSPNAAAALSVGAGRHWEGWRGGLHVVWGFSSWPCLITADWYTGILMMIIWNIYRLSMEYVWNIYGISMISWLVGGLEHLLFFHRLGRIILIDYYVSEGLKPPTRQWVDTKTENTEIWSPKSGWFNMVQCQEWLKTCWGITIYWYYVLRNYMSHHPRWQPMASCKGCFQLALAAKVCA